MDELDLCIVSGGSFGLGGDLEWIENDDDIHGGIKLEMSAVAEVLVGWWTTETGKFGGATSLQCQ